LEFAVERDFTGIVEGLTEFSADFQYRAPQISCLFSHCYSLVLRRRAGGSLQYHYPAGGDFGGRMWEYRRKIFDIVRGLLKAQAQRFTTRSADSFCRP
jgi:hypothetical protein